MRVALLALTLTAATLAAPALAAPFCLWKVPASKDVAARYERYLNLTVVQYVDLTDSDVHIVFGGGNLGSGHDLHITIKNRADGLRILQDLADTARACDKDAPTPLAKS
ncbi:hypothetical protein JCM19000A_39300 [Silvimonas sp. JCM 19000]